MANLYVGEYADIGSVGRGSVPIPQEPPHGEQAVDISALSNASDTLSDATCIVRLVSDEDCAISVGVDPDATNSVRLVSAGKEQLITVAAGSKMKIAVVASGGGPVSGFDSLGALLRVVASPTDAQKQFDALVAQATKTDAAIKALRAASDADRKVKDDLDAATKKAEAAKAANDRSVADVVAAAAAADAKEAKRVAQAESDKAEADKRKDALDNRNAGLITLGHVLDNKASVLAKSEADLVQREQALADDRATLNAAAADYATKLAKLKALTG